MAIPILYNRGLLYSCAGEVACKDQISPLRFYTRGVGHCQPPAPPLCQSHGRAALCKQIPFAVHGPRHATPARHALDRTRQVSELDKSPMPFVQRSECFAIKVFKVDLSSQKPAHTTGGFCLGQARLGWGFRVGWEASRSVRPGNNCPGCRPGHRGQLLLRSVVVYVRLGFTAGQWIGGSRDCRRPGLERPYRSPYR